MFTGRSLRVLFSILAVALVIVVASASNLATQHPLQSGGNQTSGPSMPPGSGAVSSDVGESKETASSTQVKDVDMGQVTLKTGISVKNDVSPPLSSIVPIEGGLYTEGPEPKSPFDEEPRPPVVDPVVQRGYGLDPFSMLNPLAMPDTLANFEGINNRFGGAPPDTNGDVGPAHYIQWINVSLQIFNKSGTSLYGPVAGNTLFSGFGGPCASTNNGDPIALYDSIADRWLLSQFVTSSPFGQCIAISTSPNPLGTYHRYFFQFSTTLLYDFPKFGVWPDGYYMSANTASGNFLEGRSAIAFDRARMLNGLPATYREFYTRGVSNGYTLLPSDLDGPTLPPAGSPNYFMDRRGTNNLNLYKFHVDWATPLSSTFTLANALGTAAYNTICTQNGCIPQPGTTRTLDGMGDRLMNRLAYRNFGDHESLVANHSVNSGGGVAGIRWYEVRSPASNPTIYQQGTYAPADGVSRWMGSISMDGSGDIALGYAVSNGSTVFPGIRYTGRLAADPQGTMPQGEKTLINGSGSQTGFTRYGDYSMMGIDPVDDCTFWYTQEYMQTTGAATWQTRIGSFRFPSCQPPPNPAPCVQPYLCQDLPKTICDTCTVTSSLVVPADAGTIADIDLTKLNITHAYVGDLVVRLTSPAGTTVTLIDRLCNGSVNLSNITLDDEAAGYACPPAEGASYRPPNGFLSAFDGQNAAGTWTLTVTDAAAQDAGTLNNWGLHITRSGPYSSASTNVPKPVCDQCTITSFLNVPSSVTSITDIDLTGLNIVHPYTFDLRVSLTAPDGTTAVLINQVCGNADNFTNITLDDEAATGIGSVCPPTPGGSFRPSNPLSVFDGKNASGTWTLTVADIGVGDAGTLNSWGLRISHACVAAPTATPTSTTTRTFTVTSTRTSTPTITLTPTRTRTPTATNTPTVTNTPTLAPCVHPFTSTDVPRNICDLCTITSTLTVPAGISSIADVDLTGLNISHTYMSDLRVILTSPGGTIVRLIDRVCFNGQGFNNITLDDEAVGLVCPPAPGASYRPENPMSAFDVQNSVGTWTLTISDLASGDSGTLSAWSLRITDVCGAASTSTPTRTPTSTSTITLTPTETLTNTPTGIPSLTPTPVSVLVGHVNWQARPAQPNALQQVPVTLTLKLGTTEVNYPVQTTDSSGFFTVSIGSLSNGVYNWRAKGSKWLANSGTLSLAGLAITQQEMGLLLAGDANNDNLVTVLDFNIMKNTFGRGTGDPGYDDRADFTGDARVNVSDFNQLKNNFGRPGAPPLDPMGR